MAPPEPKDSVGSTATQNGTTPAASAAGVELSRSRQSARERERWLAELAVVGVMVIWAGNFVVVKAAIGIVPPVGYSLVRFLLAGLILLAICQWQEGSVKLPRSDILPLFVIGAMGFGVYQILWPTALSTTTAGNSALLVASTPIFTCFASAWRATFVSASWQMRNIVVESSVLTSSSSMPSYTQRTPVRA